MFARRRRMVRADATCYAPERHGWRAFTRRAELLVRRDASGERGTLARQPVTLDHPASEENRQFLAAEKPCLDCLTICLRIRWRRGRRA